MNKKQNQNQIQFQLYYKIIYSQYIFKQNKCNFIMYMSGIRQKINKSYKIMGLRFFVKHLIYIIHTQNIYIII